MDPKINHPPSLVDELFSTEESRVETTQEKLIDIPLDDISDFSNHPFKASENDELFEMAVSIKESGVLVPALVRPKPEGGYEMIAGHRRKLASEIALASTLPCIVRNLTDDQAIIVMVDCNMQREKIVPSEKAFAYKMKSEAMKRQGKRTDLTSTPLVSKLRTNEKVGLESGDSREQVRRYIRLTELIPPILQMVDDGKIAFRQAVYERTANREAGSEQSRRSYDCYGSWSNRRLEEFLPILH